MESLLLKVRSLLHHEAAAGQATSHQYEGGSPHAQGPARNVRHHGARSENDANQVWTSKKVDYLWPHLDEVYSSIKPNLHTILSEC